MRIADANQGHDVIPSPTMSTETGECVDSELSKMCVSTKHLKLNKLGIGNV